MTLSLAWGARVSPLFRSRLAALCGRLRISAPSWLMACMAFETGETFSSSVRNAAGSGAVGLIQFMPGTAAALGTSVEELAALTPEDQLAWVEKYFQRLAGRLNSLGDLYGAILWPGMIGKPDDFAVFRRDDPQRPKLYLQNRGLDYNRDGLITRAEIVALVQAKLTRGYLPQNVFNPQGGLTS